MNIASQTSSVPKNDKKVKNLLAKKTHSPSEMLYNAIRDLNDLPKKKYSTGIYKIDAEKLSPFITKYMKSSVVAGALVQSKGKGTSCFLKLAASFGTSPAREPKNTTAAASKIKRRLQAGQKYQLLKPTASTKPKKVVLKKQEEISIYNLFEIKFPHIWSATTPTIIVLGTVKFYFKGNKFCTTNPSAG